MSFVFGDALESETVAVGALFATVTPVALNGAEAAAPSDAVTEYEIESPLSPLPAVPLTFQTYVSVAPSASASDGFAVAVTVSSVLGLAVMETVAAGAEFATVTAADVSAVPFAVPSLGVTATVMSSPLSPLPAA